MEKTEDVLGKADIVETITLLYYKDNAGYTVFSDEYNSFGGQGSTKQEAFNDWVWMLNEINKIEKGW